jgi:hypothetical protein
VRTLQNWLLGGACAFVIVESVAEAPGNPWFQAFFTAVVIAVAIAVSKKAPAVTRAPWIVASIVALMSGCALYAAHAAIERMCTAINGSGKRVVIGTELTSEGRKYLDANPHDNNSAVLQSLGGLGPEAAWTAASVARCRAQMALTETLWLPLLGLALICVIGSMPAAGTQAPRSGTASHPLSGKKKVFISYNHQDTAAARRLRDALNASNLDVSMDVDSMIPGEQIRDFIKRSIRESDAVVSILSAQSLLSSWVAVETINSFHRQQWVDGKLFIGAFLSDDFFQPTFRLECTREIDERLETIERLLPEYRRMIDSADLDDEKTRLYDLRNNLGAILANLANLKGSLCLNLKDEHFNASVNAIVRARFQSPRAAN